MFSFCPPTQIQLSGRQLDIETAQISIGVFINKIQASLGNAKILVDPLTKPFFDTEKYRQICSRLEQSEQVVCTCPFLGEQQTSSNTILFSDLLSNQVKNALRVKLSSCLW